MARPKKKDIVGVKIRLATSLVDQLEAAAKKRGTSFNLEAATRIGKSFAEEAQFGGEDGRWLLYFITTAFILAGNREAGKREISEWIKEPKAYVAAMFGALEAMMVAQPKVSFEACEKQIALMAD